MDDDLPVLDIDGAQPEPEDDDAPDPPVSLRLMAGDFALIQAIDPVRARDFADLCCGLVKLEHGHAKILGRDWAKLPRELAQALRGRIGRVFAGGGWLGFLDMEANILLPQLHHTRRPPAVLREAAAELARQFGLPGLPLSRPASMSNADLVRAACVRAFLCDPVLVLLESPIQAQYADLIPHLLNAIAAARDRGAAVIWLTRSDLVWQDPSFPATHRLRLEERGLLGPRRARSPAAA